MSIYRTVRHLVKCLRCRWEGPPDHLGRCPMCGKPLHLSLPGWFHLRDSLLRRAVRAARRRVA